MTRGRERALLLAILALAALLRLGACGADVPLHDGMSYAPVQDAFWYLEAAACAAEGAPVDPLPGYDPPGWVSLARVWLALAGSSWEAACALGGVLAVGLVLATWKVARSALGPGPALASAAVLGTLYPQLVQSRAPLVYGPLAVWLLAAGAVWLHGRTRRGAARAGCELAAWGMVLGAAAAFRPPVLAFAGGLACAHAVRGRRGGAALLALGAGAAGGLLLLGALGPAALEPPLWLLERLAPSLAAQLRYRLSLQLSEQLAPGVLLGRAATFLGAVGPGAGSGYLALARGACAVAALGAVLIALRWRDLRPAARELLALLLGTAAAFLLGGLVMQQRPLRYFLLLGPSLAACAGCAVAWTLRPRASAPPVGVGARAGIGLVAGLVAGHALDLAGWRGPGASALALAGGLAAAGLSGRAGRGPRLLPRTRRVLGWLLLVAACAEGLLRGAELLLAPTWTSREANRTFLQVVAPGAVPCGPYASALCIGSGLRRLRGSWVMTWPEEALERTVTRLRQERVTHLLVDPGQERNAQLVASLAGRGVEVELVAVLVTAGPSRPAPDRGPGAPVLVLRLPWAGEAGYALSAYERRQSQDATGGGPPEGEVETLAARLRALAHTGQSGQAADLLARSLRANPSLAGYGARLERALAGW